MLCRSQFHPESGCIQNILARRDSAFACSQARNDRKRGRAVQSGRILTPGLLSERISRSQATASTSVDSSGQQAGTRIGVDGEQLNHIPSTVHHMLMQATSLNLANNCFVVIPALEGLTNLQSISLAHNCITEVSCLTSLLKINMCLDDCLPHKHFHMDLLPGTHLAKFRS